MAKKKKKSTKLGDIAEKVFKPFAKVIDKVAGTDLENCEGCKKRKEYLNNIGNSTSNTLSEADTELLTDYFNKKWTNLDSKLQRRLHGVILRNKRVRISGTTSCGPCWKSTEKFLIEIAEENGIEHGKSRR